MGEEKYSIESLERALREMRAASRVRVRRLQLTGRLIAFLCLLLFLGIALLAAQGVWLALQAPLYALAPFAVLALAAQHLLGLKVRAGRLQAPAVQASRWWLLAALALACLAALRAVGLA